MLHLPSIIYPIMRVFVLYSFSFSTFAILTSLSSQSCFSSSFSSTYLFLRLSLRSTFPSLLHQNADAGIFHSFFSISSLLSLLLSHLGFSSLHYFQLYLPKTSLTLHLAFPFHPIAGVTIFHSFFLTFALFTAPSSQSSFFSFPSVSSLIFLMHHIPFHVHPVGGVSLFQFFFFLTFGLLTPPYLSPLVHSQLYLSQTFLMLTSPSFLYPIKGVFVFFSFSTFVILIPFSSQSSLTSTFSGMYTFLKLSLRFTFFPSTLKRRRKHLSVLF